MSYTYQQVASAPIQYPPRDDDRPDPPDRMEFSGNQQRAPTPPPRFDKETTQQRSPAESRRDADKESNGDSNLESTCNYKRFMRTKTITILLLLIALFFSNVMQIRILALQKHRDGIWIASIILAPFSILIQIILLPVLHKLIKSDIRNPQRQPKLETFNQRIFVIVIFLTVVNISINVLMMTAGQKNFLDTRSLEILEQRT